MPLKILMNESPTVNLYIEHDETSGKIDNLYFDTDDIPPGKTYTLKAISLDLAAGVYANPVDYYIDIDSEDKDLYQYA